MIGFYIEKSARREHQIQSSYKGVLDLQARISSLSKEQHSLEEDMFDRDQEYHQLKTQLKQATVRQKALEKIIEERHCELEYAIVRAGESNFEAYLKGHNEVFTNVKKTYGAKISNKMKKEQKDEFLQMVKDQFSKRRQEIERIHEAILAIDKQLDDLDVLVDEELPKLINKAENERAD